MQEKTNSVILTDTIGGIRQAFIQEVLDYVNDHIKRRLGDDPVCTATSAEKKSRQSCDLKVIGSIYKIMDKELGGIQKDAGQVSKSIAYFDGKLISDLGRIDCENAKADCFSLHDYLGRPQVERKIAGLLEANGFPTAEHKAYMEGQRAKLAVSGGLYAPARIGDVGSQVTGLGSAARRRVLAARRSWR